MRGLAFGALFSAPILSVPARLLAKFNLVVNLKTAKQLVVTIPPEVLYQATKVIR